MDLYDLVGADRFAAVASVLVTAFAKATAVLALGLVCAMLARGASAATRHLIWTLTLGGAIVAPVISAIVPRWTMPISGWPSSQSSDVASVIVAVGSEDGLPALGAGSSSDVVVGAPASHGEVSIATEGSTTTISTRNVAVSPDVAVMPAAASAEPSPVSDRPTFGTWLILVWALGVVITLLPTAAGFARLAIVARRARPIRGGRWALLIPSVMRELDVRRRVRFVELEGQVMPMTWGVFRPVVLLPADDFGSTIEQRLDVLRHELAHVRRYDCLTQLIGQVACALNWFNPLAWLAARELRVERERACDDEVLLAGSKASDYADYLLRVARSTRIAGSAALGGLAMARPSQMAGRLMAVLDDRRRRGRVSTWASAHATIIATVVVTGVAGASPTPAQLSDLAPEAVQGRRTATTGDGIRVGPIQLDEPATTAEPPTAAVPATTAIESSQPTLATPPVAAPMWLAPAARGELGISGPRSAEMTGPCDGASRREKGSHTNWTSSDNGSKRWRVVWSEGDCSYELEARGEIKFNRDVTDIESISSGGSFTLEQHVGDDTRRLVVRPRDEGSLERSYSENGAKHDYDAAARAWFAEALVALDRQTAFAADQRVPAILERGGVDAVLQEINLVATDYARRRYYTKLLSMRQLDRGQIRRVVEQAGSQMSSDYELAELLVALSTLDAFGDDSHTAFVAAVKKIDSDYERRRALNALLQRDRLAPATVQALLDAASTIGSDYELAELLIDVSKRYAINDQTRPTYIKALGSIESDYEHRRVLAAIVTGGGLTPAVNRTLLQDATRINSDYELAEFLIQIGRKGGLDPSTRDAYFAAADKIRSDYEHHRALTPLLAKDLLTKDLAKSILASAAKIDSDYECAQLLVELANAITIDDELRPAFDKAADTIQGEYEYGRAMSAVRRRATR
jgi:beta-lactamase regulating signal transducer with metallopeptidase domain